MATREEPLTEDQRLLVSENLNLSHHLAKQWWDKNSKDQWGDKNSDDTDLREVTSVAYQGLCSAAKRWKSDYHPEVDKDYDPRLAFAGYATIRIKGAILDWQRAKDHVPRAQRAKYKNLQALGHGSGRGIEELAEITGMDSNKIRQITQAVEATAISIDIPDRHPNSEFSTPGPEKYISSHDVESSALVTNIKSAVSDMLQNLPELQQVVIVLRYYSGHDFPWIAQYLGLRVVVIREAHAEGVLALHSVMIQEAS